MCICSWKYVYAVLFWYIKHIILIFKIYFTISFSKPVSNQSSSPNGNFLVIGGKGQKQSRVYFPLEGGGSLNYMLHRQYMQDNCEINIRFQFGRALMCICSWKYVYAVLFWYIKHIILIFKIYFTISFSKPVSNQSSSPNGNFLVIGGKGQKQSRVYFPLEGGGSLNYMLHRQYMQDNCEINIRFQFGSIL